MLKIEHDDERAYLAHHRHLGFGELLVAGVSKQLVVLVAQRDEVRRAVVARVAIHVVYLERCVHQAARTCWGVGRAPVGIASPYLFPELHAP
jgi:hypothetical protein